ncbi:MAG: xanthine dehydrogenase family protein molybdopterin-binding subunit [Alphaproteobacteria bacterium]|nr:xanthine dehydrogenase family protein molybdopterin-binding subunit [Alphaproteobacteria bacterium]
MTGAETDRRNIPESESGSGFGDRKMRREDRRFLVGRGRYTDDLKLPRQVHAIFVRSPHAHAAIRNIDTSAAKQMNGVVAVYTGSDMRDDGVNSIPPIWEITCKDDETMVEPPRWALATDKVRHVGDGVAVVLAESIDDAMNAAEHVEVDYEERAPVVDVKAAVSLGAPLVHDDAENNICFDWHIGDRAATERAFAEAKHIVALDLINTRLVGNPMEPRAAIASYDDHSGDYTLYTTSQNPHLIRTLLCSSVLNVSEHKMRVIAPDVGGGFGIKCYHYPEEVIVTWAARKCGRPVKWNSTRAEAFISDAHARDHATDAELALDENGIFLGLEVSTLANLGAHLSTWGPSIPTYLYATLLAGQYRTANIYAEVKGVFTTTLPVDAYRGADRPEANYVVERLVEAAARELGIDRIDLRRRNMISSDQMRYETPVGMTYDSGDFALCLDMAMRNIDYANFEARRTEAKARGKLRGIGVSCYIEACGLSPSGGSDKIGSRVGLYESAQVRINPDSSATVLTGSHSHGQGHETSFAQIVSTRLGIPFERIEIVHGDTARIPFGMGTYGSRSAAVGGSAIAVATDRVIAKAKHIAAHMLEVEDSDIEFEDGRFRVVGTNREVGLKEVAREAYIPHNYPLERIDPGLDETAFYDPANFTYPNGTQICEVEIDPMTGATTIERYVVVDDFGRIINPMIVEGQVHGGLAQGIGQALLENCVYDPESGQLLSGSFMDYAMPRASDLPFYEVSNHEETPCTHNPLGVKGAGEAGTIAGTTAVMSAVMDALGPVGVQDFDLPASPQRIWRAIREAAAA